MLFDKVIYNIFTEIIYSQIISKDVPIIIDLNNYKDKINNHYQLTNNISNDNTNDKFMKSLTKKKYNINIEEEKNERNQEEIFLKSNKYSKSYTIIEEKFPNPYLNNEMVKNKKYININIQSRFKSKLADYINPKKTYHDIKQNKTYKFSNNIDKYIYFTNIPINKKLQKTKTNKGLVNKVSNYPLNS